MNGLLPLCFIVLMTALWIPSQGQSDPRGPEAPAQRLRDTQYLPMITIRAIPLKSDFEKNFMRIPISDEPRILARQNLSPDLLKAEAASLDDDAQDATGNLRNQRIQNQYSSGQLPRQGIFDVIRWKRFIEAWKQGDFKRDPGKEKK
jgi:hypothetical protein